jgi:hypothetical protein
MGRSQRFREEALGRFCIASRTQEELERVALRIHSAREVHPDLFDFYVRLLNPPGVIGHVEMRAAALLQFWGIALDESDRW